MLSAFHNLDHSSRQHLHASHPFSPHHYSDTRSPLLLFNSQLSKRNSECQCNVFAGRGLRNNQFLINYTPRKTSWLQTEVTYGVESWILQGTCGRDLWGSRFESNKELLTQLKNVSSVENNTSTVWQEGVTVQSLFYSGAFFCCCFGGFLVLFFFLKGPSTPMHTHFPPQAVTLKPCTSPRVIFFLTSEVVAVPPCKPAITKVSQPDQFSLQYQSWLTKHFSLIKVKQHD